MSKWSVGSPNKTATYILPLIGDNIRQFYHSSIRPLNQFKNAFIGVEDEEFSKYDQHVFLLYKYSGSKAFELFENQMKNLNGYEGSWDCDKHHTMFVFRIPSEYLDVLSLFKEGRYSMFPDTVKNKILDFYFLDRKDSDNAIYGTLYKTEKRFKELELEFGISIPRDMEASSVPNLSEEIYLNDYKQKSVLSENESFK